MSNAVAYIRVSTDRQADEGSGLVEQEQKVRRWCDTHGHTLVTIFRDEGISGTKDTADRPGLARALTVLEGSAEILLVPTITRLARTLTVQEAILAQAWKVGARVFCADTGEIAQDDPDDPMRTFVRQVMGAASQLDRALVVARMRSGRRQKAAKGGYAGYGSPRLGQRVEAGELVADSLGQTAIARMVELRGEGLSIRAIGERLAADGLYPKRGGRWWPEVIRRTLARVESGKESGKESCAELSGAA
jgi:DNA invertase Pin-like site-specific DNA recombinase